MLLEFFLGSSINTYRGAMLFIQFAQKKVGQAKDIGSAAKQPACRSDRLPPARVTRSLHALAAAPVPWYKATDALEGTASGALIAGRNITGKV